MKKLFVAFVFLMFCNAELRAQTPVVTTADFRPRVDFSSGKFAVGVAVGDLNADSKPDIVVANQGAHTVSVFKNAGLSGNITTAAFAKTDITLTGVNPEQIFIQDMDGDGKPDVVVTSYNDKTLSILRNTTSGGTITFAAKFDVTVGYYSHSLAIGDLDGDGKADLAIGNYNAGVVTLFKNGSASGSLSFGAGVNVVTNGNPTSVSIGDADGDAHPDIAVAMHNQGIVSIIRNTNNAINTSGFAKRYDFDAGPSPYAVKLQDMDSDGKADLLVSNIDQVNAVSVLRNVSVTDTIKFAARIPFYTGIHPYGISIADIDGNGRPDILAGNWFSSGTVSVLINMNTSSGITAASFAAKVDLPTGSNPESVAIADLNGDSQPDLVAANTGDGSISVLQFLPLTAPHPAYPESTATKSRSSFVNTDLMDSEWKQDVLPGHPIAGDTLGVINGALNAAPNAGRYAYFWAMGTRTPLVRVQGNLTFTAKGSGNLVIKILAANNFAKQDSVVFALNPAAFTNYTWALKNLYPQTEYIVAVVFRNYGGAQVSAQFKKNFSLTLRQAGLNADFTRFRADSTTLIGNVERGWYGWNDSDSAARKKYLQHSAYARMRFTTSSTHMVIEYVRDFYGSRATNLFALNQTLNGYNWDATGHVIAGIHALNTYTHVTGGKTYTISGLLTTQPTYVWFQNGVPMGAPDSLHNYGTTLAPVYQLTAPAGATNLGLLIQRTVNASNPADPANNTYYVYLKCMVQEGAIGTVTPLDGTVPSAFKNYTGNYSARISGPAVFINGSIYKYYDVEGADQAKKVQYVIDDLPAGSKTVEVMMTGQGTYLPASPLVRRAGNYLRAVYFADTTTTVYPDTTKATGSIVYIHDSILSGYNISSNAQNNVWMMKTKTDPTFGFTGDIFSEGYAGRILHTDTQTPTLLEAFAQKLAAFKVDKYWFQIGVNDFGFLVPLGSFYSEYKALIERLHVLRPAAKFYIQSTGPELFEAANGETFSDDGFVATGPSANNFRDVQRALASTHAYCEYVNFEGLFPATIDNVADGIHPTDLGNMLYVNGIKNKSTLLGTTLPSSSLAFYRSSNRHFIPTVPNIHTITAKGGTAPYTFTLLSGTLPAGLTFNSDGTVTGTYTGTTASTVLLSVKVTDNVGANVTKQDTVITDATPTVGVAPASSGGFVIGVPGFIKYNGSMGSGKYTLSFVSGTLPPGTTFDAATGLLSGTPTASGSYTFILHAVDHWGFAGSSTQTAIVYPTTETYTVTAAVDTSNHLIVTGHLGLPYGTDLTTFVQAYYTQGGSEVFLGGNYVNITHGNANSSGVDLGRMALVPGSFSSRLVVTGIFPTTFNGGATTISYTNPTTASLTATATSPTQYVTVTGSINSSGHLILTTHCSVTFATTLYCYMGAGIGSQFLSGSVNIAAGQTSSSPTDLGLVTAPSGSYTAGIYATLGSPLDGYFIQLGTTSLSVTKP